MNKYKGVIFDLDGTLLDTIEDLGDSMNLVLDKYDLPKLSYEEYKLKVGGGFKGLIINCFPKDSKEAILEEGVKLFQEFYNKNYLNKTKPYEGIIDILNELNKNKIKLGINSNKRDKYTRDLANKFFKEIPFIKVYGERKGIPKKPDPTSALEIAKVMGLNSEKIIYIGDSKTDIQTAKNAGMDSIGVLWGFRSKEELMKYGVDFIVSNPKDILDIIL